jgi:hypothetical protein
MGRNHAGSGELALAGKRARVGELH